MGSNMAENHPIAFRFAMQAKERGATLIHADPRFTRTSALCDIYAPVRAGSDIAFLGGMINYVLEHDLWFKEYALAYTNLPTIIDERFRDTSELDGVFSGFDEGSCSFQATFLLRGAELAPRDRNDDGGVGVAYAALSASGADDPLVLDAAASIFPQIAAMKADRPTSRKIRAMPAWISPAVRVPGARQGAGWARPARRAGSVKASICGIAYPTASTVTQRISA